MTTLEEPTAAVEAAVAPVCPFCYAPAQPEHAFCPVCGQPGAPLPNGTLLHGVYEIAGVIATSAAGAVYRAHHRRRKREVAIKEVLAPAESTATDRAALASRFAHEAHHLAHLKHPCLVEILESFSQDGRHYLVMALLPGRDLQALLVERQRGFAERAVRDWTLRLLDLLDYLQGRHPPFVLGEITPAHLMLHGDGTPCVIGLGLAPRLGLRPYMALPGQTIEALPAQAQKKASRKARGQGPTARDDLYALGATLHALLTGTDPINDAAGQERPYPPVHDLAPRVSVGFSEVIGQATAPDPRRRFAAPAPFRAALLALPPVAGGPPAPPAAAVPASQPTSGRSGRLLGVALALVVIAIVASLVLFLRYNATQSVPGSSAAAPREANPLAISPLPVPALTQRIDDVFVGNRHEWPPVPNSVLRTGSELWLDNLQGQAPLKVTRTSYSTGRNGFTLRATLRLAQGGDAPYGLVAADRTGPTWDNLALVVRADGSWALLRYHGGHAPSLVPWQRSDAVRLGHNAPNELTLTVMPGKGGGPGTIAASINGRRLISGLRAWTTMPSGRVGPIAGPGVQIVCDELAVDPPGTAQPAHEDHFRRGGAPWSAAGAQGNAVAVTNGGLRLRTSPGRPWLQATAPGFGPGPNASAYTILATLTVHASGSGAGGVLFASAPSGAGNIALAAVVDGAGRVAIVLRGSRGVQAVAGPLSGGRVRSGYGLNLIRVTVHMLPGGRLRASVSVNGGAPVGYSGPSRGMAPAAGIVSVGDGTTVTASALRLWD